MIVDKNEVALSEHPAVVLDAVVERPVPAIRKVLNFIVNAFTVQRTNLDYHHGRESEVRVSRRPFWPGIAFLAFVVLPSLAAQVYLAFFATDQYLAEARFAVRTAEIASPMDKLPSAGFSIGAAPIYSSSSQHAYIVSSYIRSRAMVDDIMKEIDIREIYTRPEADFWARLKANATIEQIRDYWAIMVSCYVDAPSGIVKVQVLAFRQKDAVRIAEAVLRLSEKLVNDISARAREDAMNTAGQEVRRADGIVRTALAHMRQFRDTEGFIDPVKTADETGKLLATLVGEKIRLESDYFVATRTMAKDAPSVQNLRNRLDSIEVQIDSLKSRLAGNSSQARNIAGALSRFEDLELQRRFSEKLYTMAQDGLERARMQSERQAVYLTVFVPPAVPEEASYPRRIAYSIVIPFLLSILWGIGALIAASVEDHRI